MAWPISEPTFGSWQWLKSRLGAVLYGRPNAAEWTHEQAGIINDFVQRGVRRFYTPPPLPAKRGSRSAGKSHQWHFLRPNATLSVVAGDYDYDLPSDFAGFEGPMTYPPASSTIYDPITLTSEYQVRKWLAEGDWTARPTHAAYRPAAMDGTLGTRYELLLYPKPDDDYTLHYPYRVDPPDLSAAAPMPYGGPSHAETILASCIALAIPAREPEFLERLAGSVSHDQDLAAPDSLGVEYDPTADDHLNLTDLRRADTDIITYDGNYSHQ